MSEILGPIYWAPSAYLPFGRGAERTGARAREREARFAEELSEGWGLYEGGLRCCAGHAISGSLGVSGKRSKVAVDALCSRLSGKHERCVEGGAMRKISSNE